MGIDVYLNWHGQTREEQAAQEDAYLTLDGGEAGYLRESYSGGPYATKILCRDAFESPTREAQIPATVLRERLTSITEPAYGFDTGHDIAREIAEQLAEAGASVRQPGPSRTTPMAVEEAIAARYSDDPDLAQRVLASVRAFVTLAERKERQKGKPCTVRVDF